MISLWILVCMYIYILFSDKPISKNAWNIESINVTVSELITVRPPVIQLKKKNATGVPKLPEAPGNCK